MITLKFQIVLIIVMVLYFIVIFHLLKKNQLILKYALTWLITGMILMVTALFPQIIKWGAAILGVYSDVNFLFLVITAIILIIEMSLTVIVSKLSLRNKRLVQKLALLERRIEKLEGGKPDDE